MNNAPSNRIISLVPSLTETLCHFGLKEQVVGCTSFCVEPKSLRSDVESVGGTKDASVEKIIALKPSHIVVNTEENTSGLISTLKKISSEKQFQVIETFLEMPEDNFALVRLLAKLFGFQEIADHWCEKTKNSLQSLVEKTQSQREFSFIYFIWMNPWMVAGHRTYISRCLELIKGKNEIITGTKPTERYPVFETQVLQTHTPKVCLFSSEPFPFRNRHIEIFMHDANKEIPAMKVDGQALSWYGSRFAKTITYLETLRDKIDRL